MSKRPICRSPRRLRARLADGCALAKDMQAWADQLQRHWSGLHIGEPTIVRIDGRWRFSVPVFLGEVSPASVRVELFADAQGGQARRSHHASPGTSHPRHAQWLYLCWGSHRVPIRRRTIRSASCLTTTECDVPCGDAADRLAALDGRDRSRGIARADTGSLAAARDIGTRGTTNSRQSLRPRERSGTQLRFQFSLGARTNVRAALPSGQPSRCQISKLPLTNSLFGDHRPKSSISQIKYHSSTASVKRPFRLTGDLSRQFPSIAIKDVGAG